GGFADATLNANFQNLSNPIISVNATERGGGLAEGALAITNEQDPLTGTVDIGVNFASFSGNVTAQYLADGNIDVKGSVNYSGNKLSGSLTLMATDKATADNFAKQNLPGADAAAAAMPEAVPAPTGSGERGMAGMGSLNF